MCTEVVLHDDTRSLLLPLSGNLPHALALHGPEGIGLQATATYLAKQSKADYQIIYPEKDDTINLKDGSITIDIVRKLYSQTRGKSNKQRLFIITSADTMSHAAQNAFLKLLEEPASSTTFLLLIHNRNRLLATVISRLQIVQLKKITHAQSSDLLAKIGISDSTKVQQLLFIASGLPAQLTKLASDDGLFEKEASLLRQARTLIQGSPYERLLVAQSIKGERSDAKKVVGYATKILLFDIKSKQTANAESLKLLDSLERASSLLGANVNPRLVMADVALAL